MSCPSEFSKSAIEGAVLAALAPYRVFLDSGEPFSSLHRHNPWTRPPSGRDPLEWGKGWYYDTTVAGKHPYWRDKPLPRASKDVEQLATDLYSWGYCLIEDGTSAEQCSRLRERLEDQALAERQAGIAYVNAAQQHLTSLMNKGADFLGCLELDPAVVQAGPVIERLLTDALGADWNYFSFIGNVSYHGCHPQALHHDGSFVAPFRFVDAPPLINIIYVLQDVNEINGGTLLIPGTHRFNGVDGEAYGEVPAAINLEARAGAILLLDGRVLHAGAVNRSDKLRYLMAVPAAKPWFRQQENLLLTFSPEAVARASPKLLARAGFQAIRARGMVEGFGYLGTGAVGDPNGDLVHVRQALDRGEYQHLGALSQRGPASANLEASTLVQLQRRWEARRTAKYKERQRRIVAA